MKQRKRYWRWRVPTTLIRATSRTPECTEDPNFPDFGIALVAVGGKFHRWSRILIQSLRDTGAYHGLFPDELAIDQQQRACFVHITRHRYRMLGHDRLHYYLADVLGVAHADERLDFS